MGDVNNGPDTAGECGVFAQSVNIARLGWLFACRAQLFQALHNGFGHFLQCRVQGFGVAVTMGKVRRYGTEARIFDIVDHDRVTHR